MDEKQVLKLATALAARLQTECAEFLTERGLTTANNEHVIIALLATLTASGYLGAHIDRDEQQLDATLAAVNRVSVRQLMDTQLNADFDRALGQLRRRRTMRVVGNDAEVGPKG